MIDRNRHIGRSRFLIVVATTLTVFLRLANAEMPTDQNDRDYALMFYEKGALIVVLPAKNASLGGRKAKTWSPTASQVRTAERTIVSALEMAEPTFSKEKAQYVRQYFGLFRDGRRTLNCVIFHENLFSLFLGESTAFRIRELLSEPFVLTDSDDYFYVEYDIEKGTIVKIQ